MINTTYGRTSSQIIMDDGRNEGIALGRNEGIALGEEIGAKKTRIQNIFSAYQRLGDKDIVCTAFDCTLEETHSFKPYSLTYTLSYFQVFYPLSCKKATNMVFHHAVAFLLAV